MLRVFTNIPQDLVIECIKKAANEDDTLMDRTLLDVESIVNLTRLCIEANIFQFDKLYKQVGQSSKRLIQQWLSENFALS